MREIKFRVWNTISKIMKPFSEIKRCGVFAIADGLNSDDFIILPLKNSILNEYTGTKDKNGVEIYEGDIVKYKLISRELIAKVEFNKIKLGIDFVDDVVKLSYAYNFRQISNIEVIGNIYENPDLLKG